jgi:hypothetical protein
MINRDVVGCQIELKMNESEPGSLGQAKESRKSTGPLLQGKEKITINIPWRSQLPSILHDR